MNDISIQNDAVKRLEQDVLQMPQVDLRTEHTLVNGVYARTVYIPAGTVVTGATHKKDNINIVIGDVTTTSDEGARRITGHQVFATKAGGKRAVFAHVDTVWTTVCPTALTDIAAIEDELVEESDRLQTRALAITAQAVEKLEE